MSKYTTGSCSLIITGQELDFEKINQQLKLKPSECLKKGEIVSKSIGELRNDIWVYEKKFGLKKTPSDSLKDFLDKLKQRKNLKEIANIYNVSIRYFIQSELAQVYFEFSPEILKDLSDLNVKFETSVFSWGGVRDN